MHLILGPDGLTTELNFKIPIVTLKNNKVNRVGVFVSAGLDSAALLCLVISELKATNRLDSTGITAFTIIKDDGSTYYAQRVIDKISNLFGISITHVNNLLNDTDAYAAGRVGGGAIRKVYEDTHNDMILYMAVNQMAPDDVRPFSQTLKIKYQETDVFQSPFLSLHKPQILDIYYKLDCKNIIQYTHSCTVQGLGSCNNCYSCKEREWGFSALGKEVIHTVDPDVEDISFGGTWQYSIQNH